MSTSPRRSPECKLPAAAVCSNSLWMTLHLTTAEQAPTAHESAATADSLTPARLSKACNGQHSTCRQMNTPAALTCGAAHMICTHCCLAPFPTYPCAQETDSGTFAACKSRGMDHMSTSLPLIHSTHNTYKHLARSPLYPEPWACWPTHLPADAARPYQQSTAVDYETGPLRCTATQPRMFVTVRHTGATCTLTADHACMGGPHCCAHRHKHRASAS